MAGSGEESCVHGCVRGNLDLFSFAEADEVLCGEARVGHDLTGSRRVWICGKNELKSDKRMSNHVQVW